ncbi:MAG: hypothetical protein KBF76_11280 [Verrucomicrobiales bacterium]|nr:hypothetical protein [Verrucomicrobiales bacterium]
MILHTLSQIPQLDCIAPPEIFPYEPSTPFPDPYLVAPGTDVHQLTDQPPGQAAAVSSNGSVTPALETQILTIEKRLECLKNKNSDELVEDLKAYAKGAMESATAALSAAHYAIIYAWATGCVLNLAKENLGKGRFGAWRDVKVSDLEISLRRAQMWMKMARDCSDVRALLVPGASLTTTYRATGVLPEADSVSPHQDDTGQDGDQSTLRSKPTPTERVFTALAEGRKRLRHLGESEGILDDADRDRLEEEKAALITLIDTLLYPIVP